MGYVNVCPCGLYGAKYLKDNITGIINQKGSDDEGYHIAGIDSNTFAIARKRDTM
jgi:hypothetical protein